MTSFAVPLSHGLTARRRAMAATLAAAFSAFAFCAHAANVPSGVQLAAKQELVRNNASEVETLDPNLVETVPANNVSRGSFRRRHRDRCRRQRPAGRRREVGTEGPDHLDLSSAQERQMVQWRGPHRKRFRLRRPAPRRSETGVGFGDDLRQIPAERHGHHRGQEAGDGTRRARHRREHARGEDAVSGAVPAGTDVEHDAWARQQGRGREIRQGLDQARQAREQRRVRAEGMAGQQQARADEEPELLGRIARAAQPGDVPARRG